MNFENIKNNNELIEELEVSNMIKVLNIFAIREMLYPPEVKLLVDTIKTHIMLNVYKYQDEDDVDELIVSNMLDALKLRHIRWSLNSEELELLINFVRCHVTFNAEKLLEKNNKKILKKSKKI